MSGWTDDLLARRNAEVFGGSGGKTMPNPKTSPELMKAFETLLNSKPKTNKYHVSPKEQRTYEGIVFASKAECVRYQELLVYQRAGLISGLERQPEFPFPMGFSYFADFRYFDVQSKRVVVEDVKGVETKEFKLKRKCMKYYFPEVHLEIIKK